MLSGMGGTRGQSTIKDEMRLASVKKAVNNVLHVFFARKHMLNEGK